MRKLHTLLLALLATLALSAQTISSVTPNTAPQGTTGLTVEISGVGTNFSQGTYTYVYFSQGTSTNSFTGNNTVVNSATSLSTIVDIPFTSATGVYDIMVYDGTNTTTLASGFTVSAGPVAQITTVDTNYAAAGTTLNVSISGINTSFQSGTSTEVWFSQGSSTIYPNFINVLSQTQIVANVTLDPAQDFGFYDVNVYDDIDNVLTLLNGFVVTDTSVGIITVGGSGYGTIGDSATLIITASGTHFGAQGTTTTVWLGEAHRSMVPNIISTSVQVISPTQLSVTFHFPHGSSSGLYDVFVLNTIDGELTKERAFDLEAASGIQDISADHITIYPNPVRDALTVEVAADMIGSAYTLTDLTGRMVAQGGIDAKVSTLAVSGLSSGLYMLHIGSQSYKVIKQ